MQLRRVSYMSKGVLVLSSRLGLGSGHPESTVLAESAWITKSKIHKERASTDFDHAGFCGAYMSN